MAEVLAKSSTARGATAGSTRPIRPQTFVVVPAYNEEARILETLRALASQTNLDFTLVVVDNGSTDRTVELVKEFADTAPIDVELVVEPERGVGSVVDTGFRYAISRGAGWIARTDADCLPHPGWLEAACVGFEQGGELVYGRIVARRDENGIVWRAVFRLLVWLAATFGRLRKRNRDPKYLAPYTMHAGNNMAVTADVYIRCGGMPRMPSPTDRTFLNRVRATTSRIVRCPGMVVENSLRRIRAYGIRRSAKWYLERGSGSLLVDPR